MIGEGEVLVIDPGPDDPAHLDAILAELGSDEKIVAILVTHPHADHSGLVGALKAATGAKSWGYGPAGSGRSQVMQDLAQAGIGGGEGADMSFIPDHLIRDGDLLGLAGLDVQVIHTPGHMAEHLAFGIGDTLFCGDLLMAWAPSLVSPPDGDMGAYMRSLGKLQGAPWSIWRPTHGAPLLNPDMRIEELMRHRLSREAQILAALAIEPATIDGLLPIIYSETPRSLWPAARRNLLAHLLYLREKGSVSTPNPLSETSFFRMT